MTDNSKKSENTKRIANPLSRFKADEPEYIPDRFASPFKRSVYFPEGRGSILYQATQIAEEIGEMGVNDIVAEALELWIAKYRAKYIETLYEQLSSYIAASPDKAPKEILDTLDNLQQEIERYKETPQERYQHFFYSVLDSMIHCGWAEMSGMVNKTIRNDIIEAEAKYRKEERNSETHEYAERLKMRANRLKRNQNRHNHR